MTRKQSYPHLDMFYQDGSGIAVEHWRDSWSVDMHWHKYCELMIVNRGSLRHMFHGVETLLIPGDAVLVYDHEIHGYQLHGEISIYNCQFEPESLDHAAFDEILRVLPPRMEAEASLEIEAAALRESMRANVLPRYEPNSSKQGVLHLEPAQHTFLSSLIERMLNMEKDASSLKKKYMEIILLELSRTINRHNHEFQSHSAKNQKVIAEVLANMETHLADPFVISEVAQQYSFSANYFRKLFKDVTGLSPIQYLNRIRIVQACAYMERQGMAIREAAELVGIYDLNYFSRLFKKIIGCPPNKI